MCGDLGFPKAKVASFSSRILRATSREIAGSRRCECIRRGLVCSPAQRRYVCVRGRCCITARKPGVPRYRRSDALAPQAVSALPGSGERPRIGRPPRRGPEQRNTTLYQRLHRAPRIRARAGRRADEAPNVIEEERTSRKASPVKATNCRRRYTNSHHEACMIGPKDRSLSVCLRRRQYSERSRKQACKSRRNKCARPPRGLRTR